MLKRERVVVTDLLATLRTIGRNAISAAELAFSRSLDSSHSGPDLGEGRVGTCPGLHKPGAPTVMSRCSPG